MKLTKSILVILIFAALLAGCASMPWSDKEPDNRLRKSPCACLEVGDNGKA